MSKTQDIGTRHERLMPDFETKGVAMNCECRIRTYMVGDGCDICNPAKALEYAYDTLRSMEEDRLALRVALNYARSGFDLAYAAAEKNLNDEVLLHCGHHSASLDKALDA